jgi:uncharacterized surface anchored protein
MSTSTPKKFSQKTWQVIALLPLLFLAVIISACQKESPVSDDPAANNKVVSGILRDEQGFIVPNAIVEVLAASSSRIAADTTDESGAFSLSGLPQEFASLQLRVSHNDFKPFVASLSEAVMNAGAPTGLLLSVDHNDSCCGRLSMRVTNQSGGAAISGAEVKLRRNGTLVTTVYTDTTGLISFENLCGGTYSLRIAKDGFGVVERNATIEHCDSTSLDIRMEANSTGGSGDTCCGGYLRIIPRDSATNAVITGASVRITRSNGTVRTLTSNGDGAIFREVCQGQWGVRIAREGYRVIEFSVTMECNDSSVTTRTLAHLQEQSDSCCHGQLTVIARDSANNNLLTGATIKLWRGGTLLATRTMTGEGVGFDGLCSGQYVIDILRDGYRHVEVPVTMGCSSTLEVMRKLLSENSGDTCCRGVLSVNVGDSATGSALTNASVRLWRGGQLIRTVTTSSNGTARFAELCSGSYGVSISREGYAGREFEVTLTCNQTVETSKRLLANSGGDTCCNAVLRLRVKDSTVTNDGWLSGVTVTITRGNTTIASGTTGSDGGYGRESLCGQSTYTVTFSKDGYQSKTVTFTYTTCTTKEETIRLVPN